MSDDPASTQDADTPPKTPRWVAVLGLGIFVAALLLVIGMLVMGGGHGPGRHG